MAGTLADVNDNNFQAEVIESETAVLVDFWAPWCSPCRVVAPILEEIAAEREDLRIVKLNIDDNQPNAAAFQVLSIPTMILFRGGRGSMRSGALSSWSSPAIETAIVRPSRSDAATACGSSAAIAATSWGI